MTIFDKIAEKVPTAGTSQSLVDAFVLLCILLACFPTSAISENQADTFQMVSSARFASPKDGAKAEAEAIAHFTAKRKAVETASRYLKGKHRLWFAEKKSQEVFDLTAEMISFKVLEEEWTESDGEKSYRVKIAATVELADFIEAENENAKYEEKERHKGLRQFMEPTIDDALRPGRDLAEAYRLIRLEKQRPAVIFLDRLEKKYPGWSELFMAKAFAFYTLDEIPQMRDALNQACNLGNETACEDIEMMRKAGEVEIK